MTSLKKHITQQKLPDLAGDIRAKAASASAADFGKLLRKFVRGKPLNDAPYTLLGLWHLSITKSSDAIKITSPDAKCAGMRWLKSRWQGEPISAHDFHQFWGVVAGTQQFHDELLQLQHIATQMFAGDHPLRRVAYIAYLLQAMLASALTHPEDCVEIPSFGSIASCQTEKHHTLQLSML